MLMVWHLRYFPLSAAVCQVVRVLNNVTWQPLLECHHGSPVDEPAEVAVYQEVEEPRGVLAPMQVSLLPQRAWIL